MNGFFKNCFQGSCMGNNFLFNSLRKARNRSKYDHFKNVAKWKIISCAIENNCLLGVGVAHLSNLPALNKQQKGVEDPAPSHDFTAIVGQPFAHPHFLWQSGVQG